MSRAAGTSGSSPSRVSLALAAAFLWLPRRYAPVLPVVVALGFFLTWLPLQLWIHSFPRLSSAAYTTGIGAGKGWIDALSDGTRT